MHLSQVCVCFLFIADKLELDSLHVVMVCHCLGCEKQVQLYRCNDSFRGIMGSTHKNKVCWFLADVSEQIRYWEIAFLGGGDKHCEERHIIVYDFQ